jgi:ribosomal protein L40E
MIVCKKCGNENETGATFCGSCGAFLEWSGETITEEAAEQDEPTVALAIAEVRALTDAETPEAETETEAILVEPTPDPPAAITPPSIVEAAVPIEEPSPSHEAAPAVEEPAPDRPFSQLPPVVKPPRKSRPKLPSAPKADAPASEPAPAAAARPMEPLVVTQRDPAPEVDVPQKPDKKEPGVERPAPALTAPPPGPAARPPSALQPRKPAPTKPRPPAKAPTPPKIINPGDLVCGECGEGNDPTRRFCRKCGNSLREAVIATEEALPWWKRIFRRRRTVLRAGQRLGRAGTEAGRRGRSTVEGARRTASTVVKLLAVAGIVVGGVVAYPKVKDAITHKTEPVRPKTIAASSQLRGHEAALAADGFKNTWWTENAPGDGINQSITFSFETPTELSAMLITAGAEKTAQPRPRIVIITFYDASGAVIDAKTTTLPDTDHPHAIDVGLHGVKRVEIKISAVYPAVNKAGSRLSISEVEFERKA